MSFNVLITKEISNKGLTELKKRCNVTVYSGKNPITKAELLKFAPDLDAIIVSSAKIDADFIKKAKNLKIISRCGVGYDSVDIKAATKKGIPVTNLPFAVTESTAELTFAIMLALTRKILQADDFVRSQNNNWNETFILGNNLYNKKMGIIGFGRIGQAVARRALAFGMKIYYYDLNKVDSNLDVTYLTFQGLLKEMDYISLHVPYTKETHHLIGSEELKIMKDNSYLINVARGSIIDEEALIKTLSNKGIAGAALDVFEKEPYVPDKLVELSNVILTPHIGTSAIETRNKMSKEVARRVMQVVKGQTPDTIVNLEYKKYQ